MLLLAALLFALWLWQLLNCLRREALPPLFGSERFARGFWLASFLLLDPVQVLLYILFVRMGFLGKPGASRLRSVAVPAVLVAIAALQFGWIGVEADEHFVATHAEQPSTISLSARATWAGMNTSSRTTKSDPGMPVAQRHLRVVAGSDHPLIAASGRAIARDLAELPFVDEVEYAPFGSRPEEGARAPDMVLTLEADIRTDVPTMIYTRLRGAVRATLSPSPPPTRRYGELDPRLTLGQFRFRGTLDLDFQRAGFALGADRYGDPAEVLRSWIAGSVSEAMRELDAHGRTLPAADYGFDYVPGHAPKAIAQRGAEQLDSEGPRFQHHRTRWSFRAGPDPGEVLASLGADLEAEGWHEEWASDEELGMRRGDEYVFARQCPERIDASGAGFQFHQVLAGGREPEPEETLEGDLPYIAVHGALFSDAELDRVFEVMFEQAADVLWLLVFSKRLTPVQAAELLSRLEGRVPTSANDWVVIADVAERLGATERAEQAITNALVLVTLGFGDGVQRSSLTSRLEELPASLDEIDLEMAAAAGLTPLETGAEAQREVGLGQAAQFVTRSPDGKLQILHLTFEEARGGGLEVAYRASSEGRNMWSTRAMTELDDGNFKLPLSHMFQGVGFEGWVEPIGGDHLRVHVSLVE